MSFELEIIATTAEMCIAAEKHGATRIELCAGMSEGGTTPSAGLIKAAIQKAKIPVYVMIRPRGGDFLYSDTEYETMLADILLCKNLGAPGIVTGILNKDGTIDRERNCRITELAYPLGVTFHRAFDRATNPMNAVKAIIDCGFERILSSGQKPTAMEGRELLKSLIQQFGNDIIIMPGSGINADNIEELAKITGATNFHLSGKTEVPSKMEFVNQEMQEQLNNATLNVPIIERVIEILKTLFPSGE